MSGCGKKQCHYYQLLRGGRYGCKHTNMTTFQTREKECNYFKEVAYICRCCAHHYYNSVHGWMCYKKPRYLIELDETCNQFTLFPI